MLGWISNLDFAGSGEPTTPGGGSGGHQNLPLLFVGEILIFVLALFRETT